MKILMVAAEVTPLIKVGGLADVVGALPTALASRGHDVRILLPRYGTLVEHGFVDTTTGVRVDVPWDGRVIPVEVFSGVLPGTTTPLYTLEAPEFFYGGAYVQDSSPEGYRAQMQRFAFFSWAAAHVIPKLPWLPDVIHCHDWHAASLPLWLRAIGSTVIPSVMTIHNIESQGKWSASELFGWLGLNGDEFETMSVRSPGGDFNFLQQGVLTAEGVTTVSPTYAKEILQPEFGQGLEETLRALPSGVVGIVNGIDTARFDPETDSAIEDHYSSATVMAGKAANRARLAAEFGLAETDQPILGLVSRLTMQKGVELLVEALPAWVRAGGRVAVLGTGQPELEQRLVGLAKQFPAAVGVRIGFDAKIAQLVYAGADFFAMPSRFEPCGLGQLIAMRYGALPIVRDTGGLHDTVIDVTTSPANGTGFVFQDFSAAALTEAFAAALRLWQKPDILNSVRQRAMRQDFSWTASADAYLRVYANLKKTP